MRHLALFTALLVGCNATTPLSTVDDGSNAVEAWIDANGRRTEAFAYGGEARNEVVDFLFVIDNSISMASVVERIQENFQRLEHDRWPAEARIAVMSTLPGEPDKLSRPHRKAVRNRTLAQHDPGFLRLVSHRTIERARSKRPFFEENLPHRGCENWFRPGDADADGTSCLVAHTALPRVKYLAEAGLIAVEQYLDKRAGRPSFRPGASVNIVFVSDTHGPGLPAGSANVLLDIQPTATDLIEAIQRDNAVSSVRFHAIAPETQCVEPWMSFGPTYFQAVEETGGAALDVCTAEDYGALLDAVLTEGAKPMQPVFGLAVPPESIEEVRLDGEPVGFTPHPRLPAVTLDALPDQHAGALPSMQHRVEIAYRAPLAPVRVAPVPDEDDED